jgi:DNA-binding beta-propeller fold protein YncE
MFLSAGFFEKPQAAQAAENSQYFPQTKHTVSGAFLTYWQTHGGLATFGYPISEAQAEIDPETGKSFLTQWFERNRFELHPENAGTNYEVELGLLGKDLRREALTVDANFAPAKPLGGAGQLGAQQIYFTETSHNLSYAFLSYWQQNGGLERFGYPISEEHTELDPATGKVFDMQWFERARFEYHPENTGTPYLVLLGLLGQELQARKSHLSIQFDWQIDSHANSNIKIFALLCTDKQGNIYNREGTTIEKLDSMGHLLSSLDIDKLNQPVPDPHHPLLGYFPTSLAIDSHGNWWVALDVNAGGLTGGNSLQEISSDGKIAGGWAMSGLGSVESLAIDGQDNIYIDNGQRHIIEFNNAGQQAADIDLSASITGTTSYITRVGVNSAGTALYVNTGDDYLQKFDLNGNLLQKWGGEGHANGQFSNLKDLAVDSQGNIYTSEGGIPAESGNDRIQKFDSNGKFLEKWGGRGTASGQFVDAGSLIIDKAGHLYVTDAEDIRLEKFN